MRLSGLKLGFVAAALCLASIAVQAQPPETFSQAKLLTKRVWADHRTDFYCGCTYDARQNVAPTCAFPVPLTRKGAPNERARRIEWEHVVPAADFGRQRACWRDPNRPQGVSTREYCEEVDPTFARMHADPRNLVPAIGLLNQYRSDHRYGEVSGEAREYGACDFEMSPAGSDRFVEPPANVKGDLARVYFYYEQTYGHRIGRSQRQLFEAWSRMDPPDAWELERDRRLEAATRTVNPILQPYQQQARR